MGWGWFLCTWWNLSIWFLRNPQLYFRFRLRGRGITGNGVIGIRKYYCPSTCSKHDQFLTVVILIFQPSCSLKAVETIIEILRFTEKSRPYVLKEGNFERRQTLHVALRDTGTPCTSRLLCFRGFETSCAQRLIGMRVTRYNSSGVCRSQFNMQYSNIGGMVRGIWFVTGIRRERLLLSLCVGPADRTGVPVAS